MVNLITDIKSKAYTREQILVLLVAASLFMPFFISIPVIAFTVVYAFFYKPFLHDLKVTKDNILYYLLGLLVLAVPLIYGRYISLLMGFVSIIMVLLFVFIKNVITTKLFESALDMMCIGSVVSFLYAIGEKIACGINVRCTGGMFNANYYGAMCEFLMLVAAYKLLVNKKKWMYYLPAAIFSFCGIIFSDCRSAWAATIIALVAFVLLSQNKKKAFITLLVCCVVFLVSSMLPGLLPRIDQTSESMQIRMNIWITAIQGIKHHFFFGQGIMTYWFTYMNYNGFATYHAHNIYLDLLLNVGVIGSFIVAYYCLILCKKIRQEYKISKESKRRTSLIIGIIICVLVHGVTDATILWVQTSGVFFIFLSGLYIKSENSIDKIPG